jgi:hypothetical protein
MNFIGQRILNETELLHNDQPHYFKNFISNPEEILSWNDVESCLNRPEIFNFEMIDKDTGMKIDIPVAKKAWVWDHVVQDKAFMIDKFNRGHGLVIMNYGSYSEQTTKLLSVFERLFDINAAIHVYCGLEGSASFPIHDDYPVNFIIQVEGKTRWKVFKNRISYLYKIGSLNDRSHNKRIDEEDLEVAIDVELEPGDGLYIPSRCYHAAYPTGKRLSMSIPCWAKYPNDLPSQTSDRNWYNIRKD